MNSTLKTILIIAAIAIVIYIVYNYFYGNTASAAPTDGGTPGGNTSVPSQSKTGSAILTRPKSITGTQQITSAPASSQSGPVNTWTDIVTPPISTWWAIHLLANGYHKLPDGSYVK